MEQPIEYPLVTIVDDDAEYVVVRVQAPSLTSVDSKGNVNGAEARR